MNKTAHYIVSSTIADDGTKVWFCHSTLTPNVPVFGSIGTKAHALAVARIRNRSIGYCE